MSRIYSTPGEDSGPLIDKKSVSDFFEKRAEKIASLGPVQAVIYQDKHPELAAQRNVAEKAKLLPLFRLNGTQRVLDVGCGTGRWAGDLLPLSAWYHGIDSCEGLVLHARKEFEFARNGRFTVAAADDFSLESLGESQPFDRILCAGVLIYLNDDEVQKALLCMANVLAPGGLILLREPVGIERRLTIAAHYSDDMDQVYNAIYRTRGELDALVRAAMPAGAFRMVDSGDVYDESALNNRVDTKQQWLLLERA
jgi:SAM-dependent methyltransferase